MRIPVQTPEEAYMQACMQSTSMYDATRQNQQLLSVVPHTLDAVEGHAWAATKTQEPRLFDSSLSGPPAERKLKTRTEFCNLPNELLNAAGTPGLCYILLQIFVITDLG